MPVTEALSRLISFSRQVAGDIEYTGDHPIAAAERALKEAEELEQVCAEAYQVVALLADACGVFETSEGVSKMLDNLSECRMVHNDILPFSVDEVKPHAGDGPDRK
ncbi:hypothetical protein FXI37_03830 [Escherichia coli]|nr:hypothetical protein [Escherichia coli]EFE3811439.1 hypothetical protein [Escherichia coli]EJF6665608.1 hypothetical protein [Escherichia coli]EJK1952079.1 hypothetical protein [Escherichia coli]HCN8164554.1 hypothetical protein [Escherichia coli]